MISPVLRYSKADCGLCAGARRRKMDMAVTFLQGYICDHKIRKSFSASI